MIPISILFKVIFCEIDYLLTTNRSDTNVSNYFSPIVSKSWVTVLIDSGTMIFFVVTISEVILHKSVVMHLISRLTSEENLPKKVGYLHGAWHSTRRESHFNPDNLRTQVLHGQYRDYKFPNE